MAPAGSKVTLDPATFMLSNKRLIGCTEGDSVPYEVGVIHTLVVLQALTPSASATTDLS
jgi:hypothetical protein